MLNVVEQQFEKIKQNIGRSVEVTAISHDREIVTKGILEEFEPYNSVDILLGSNPLFSETQTCAFTGVRFGIKTIKDAEGNELYRNDFLDYKKKFYNLWIDKEDNLHINLMRRDKFGEGHDYKLLE